MNIKDLFDVFFAYMSDYGASLETIIVGLIILLVLVIVVFVKIITSIKNKSSSTQKNVVGVNTPFSHSNIGDNNMIITGNNNTINDESKIKSIADEKIKENNKNYHKTVIVDANNKPVSGENHTLVFKRK